MYLLALLIFIGGIVVVIIAHDRNKLRDTRAAATGLSFCAFLLSCLEVALRGDRLMICGFALSVCGFLMMIGL